MQRRVVLLMGLLLFLAPSSAKAVMTVSVGAWTLLPGVANQTVDFITAAPIALIGIGGDVGDGMDLRNFIAGGVGPAPFIDGINIGGGAGAVGAPTAVPDGSHLFTGGFLGIALSPDGISPPDTGLSTSGGMLVFSPVALGAAPFASFSFSTVGVSPGVYSWSLATHPTLGPTTFLTSFGTVAVPTTLIDGTITVIPEPGSIVLCLFGAAGVAFVGIRRRRHRTA